MDIICFLRLFFYHASKWMSAVMKWAFTSASSPVCTSCSHPLFHQLLYIQSTDCKDVTCLLNSIRQFTPLPSSEPAAFYLSLTMTQEHQQLWSENEAQNNLWLFNRRKERKSIFFATFGATVSMWLRLSWPINYFLTLLTLLIEELPHHYSFLNGYNLLQSFSLIIFLFSFQGLNLVLCLFFVGGFINNMTALAGGLG